MPAERMSPLEVRAGVSLAGVYGLRMLGLFVILPVFAVHAAGLRGGDDLSLVGVALGAYGLAQGILQIPFGLASDRWGRKPALYVGLAVFAAGSFLGLAAHDIWTAIAARALQGAGAISSVAMALAADLTREEHRTKIMAMIGSTIGLMFALSLVGAPVLYRWIGMDGLFALTGALSLIAMWVVRTQVPEPPARAGAPAKAPGGSTRLLEPDLLRLNAGIFILHILLYAMFVVVPSILVQDGLALPQHWKLYLPVVLASFAAMVPAILYADRRNGAKPVLLASVGAAARSRGRADVRAALGGRHRPSHVRFLRCIQCAGSHAAVARVARRPGAGPRRRNRGVQHDADPRGVLRRRRRRLGRRPPWRERGVRHLRPAGGRLARARRRNASGAPRGQRGFESDVVDSVRGQSRGAERSARARARGAASRGARARAHCAHPGSPRTMG